MANAKAVVYQTRRYRPALPADTITDGSDNPIGSGGVGYMSATYSGSDTPGNGSNTLSSGYSRIWKDTVGVKVYLVTNVSGSYYSVELGLNA